MTRVVNPRDFANQLVSVVAADRARRSTAAGRNLSGRASPVTRNVTIRGVAVQRPTRLSPEQAHELLEAWRTGALPPVSRVFLNQLLQHSRQVNGNSAMRDQDLMDLLPAEMGQELLQGSVESDQDDLLPIRPTYTSAQAPQSGALVRDPAQGPAGGSAPVPEARSEHAQVIARLERLFNAFAANMGRKELQADQAYSAFIRRVFRTRDHFLEGLHRRIQEVTTPHVFSRVDGMVGKRLSVSWLSKSDFTGPVPVGRETHHEGSSLSKRVADERKAQAAKFQPPERSASFFDDLRSASLLLQPSFAAA